MSKSRYLNTATPMAPATALPPRRRANATKAFASHSICSSREAPMRYMTGVTNAANTTHFTWCRSTSDALYLSKAPHLFTPLESRLPRTHTPTDEGCIVSDTTPTQPSTTSLEPPRS
jgi:hypothetical protein